MFALALATCGNDRIFFLYFLLVYYVESSLVSIVLHIASLCILFRWGVNLMPNSSAMGVIGGQTRQNIPPINGVAEAGTQVRQKRFLHLIDCQSEKSLRPAKYLPLSKVSEQSTK